jgi:hypothetical protein
MFGIIAQSKVWEQICKTREAASIRRHTHTNKRADTHTHTIDDNHNASVAEKREERDLLASDRITS